MIEVTNVTKNYGKKPALQGISFSIGKGEVVGFLGPNGAGKSTTMNILTGYISPTGGSVKVGGYDILENPTEAKRLIGFLPENPPLYHDMTVDEYLRFLCKIKSVSLPVPQHLDRICELVGISHMRKRLIRNLSKGYRQRTGLAGALIGDPQVIVLDEPTVGLDPIQIIEIRNVIKELGKQCTIILSSHILPEIQAICQRVIVIDNGLIVADGSVEQLAATTAGGHRLMARITGNPEELLPLLQSIPDMERVQQLTTGEETAWDYLLEGAAGTDIRAALFRHVADSGQVILLQKSADMNLEEIFLKLTLKDG